MFGISSFAEAPFSTLPGLTVTVALSGVSSTGSAGTEIAAVKEANLTAVTGTGSVGSIVWQKVTLMDGNVAYASIADVGVTSTTSLSGTSGTSSVGSVIFSRVGTVTGISATGSVGSISDLTRDLQLSGLTGVSSVGNAQAGKDRTLTSVSLTSTVLSGVPSVVVTLSGVSALGSLGTFGVAPHWALIDNPENVTWQLIETETMV